MKYSILTVAKCATGESTFAPVTPTFSQKPWPTSRPFLRPSFFFSNIILSRIPKWCRGGASCILAVYPWNYARTFLSILARILARILAVGILGILGILGVRILGILGMSL